LRPGVTGSWQVSDRNDCSFRGRAQYDDLYEHNITFAGDVRILWRTLVVVFRCTGY
jgi:lipopolysaccharide/colanic/teichoic acid biosynthesis glycosyltransferase